ncbi:MAG TPA: 7-cyano-7-deazaguanine synthase QueC [Planctomycetota bacterium]|nr:7-cyano-7-deazaguanine synthase QueC [Planctomycetota bacterium]
MAGRPVAVVLASGGMDSCVLVALAAQEHTVAMLHANYGQRTMGREKRAFDAIADFYRVPPGRRLTVDLGHLAAMGGSALTDRAIAVPEGKLGREGIPVSYVPFRNANLLSAAASWGEVLGASRIFFGAMEEDSSGYPDCRGAFVEAFNRAIEAGTRPETRIEVVAPLLHLTKAEVVRRGTELGAPFHLTWSCYQGEDVACGRCDSCLLRLRGFREAGVPDPISYASAEASRQ